MPAIGFCLIIKHHVEKEYFGFLIAGFVLSAYLGLDLVAFTLVAISIALYDYYSNAGAKAVAVAREDEEDGI